MQTKLRIKAIPYEIELLSFFSWCVYVIKRRKSQVNDGDNMIIWSLIRFVVYWGTLMASILSILYEWWPIKLEAVFIISTYLRSPGINWDD